MTKTDPITALWGPDPVLFVDCDDTLIQWRGDPNTPHPFGTGALVDPQTERPMWDWNHHVVKLVNEWPGHVVVWSGGGTTYATGWTQGLIESQVVTPRPSTEGSWLHVLDKIPSIPRAQDTVIEDDNGHWGFEVGNVIHPRNLPEVEVV